MQFSYSAGIYIYNQGISTGGNVECDMTYINPEGLQLPPDDMETFQQESGGAGGVSDHEQGGRTVPTVLRESTGSTWET